MNFYSNHYYYSDFRKGKSTSPGRSDERKEGENSSRWNRNHNFEPVSDLCVQKQTNMKEKHKEKRVAHNRHNSNPTTGGNIRGEQRDTVRRHKNN